MTHAVSLDWPAEPERSERPSFVIETDDPEIAAALVAMGRKQARSVEIERALRRVCDAKVGALIVADLEPWLDVIAAVEAAQLLLDSEEPT